MKRVTFISPLEAHSCHESPRKAAPLLYVLLILLFTFLTPYPHPTLLSKVTLCFPVLVWRDARAFVLHNCRV